MSPKLTGYDFWRDVLKFPKYVAAPMVDMSELSFRMFCRGLGAQLCFSPMLHSQQYLQDVLYRSDNFSTCPEDSPLIVQFCSNDPCDFVNAASLVASKCSAVDLNLGCPQAIARKGHYGAFLQDDMELIHSIVRKASLDLPVPVTCKMRILSGSYKKSIEYAKMLEQSGCSVLTVHGRTREQKGHATGLASWEAIRAIKENVGIPVIANGNILSFSDLQGCLEATTADAVMSAEALLHNPALFSRRNPPVWTVIEEYLHYAEKYNTPLRIVRCHLFKILYLCIHLEKDLQEMVATAKTYADFYHVCNWLKALPQKFCSTVSDQLLKITENVQDAVSSEETCDLGKLKQSSSDSLSSESTEKSNLRLSIEEKLLPVWVCHSRPRVVDEQSYLNSSRGSFRKYFEPVTEPKKSPEDSHMSKKKMRKLRRYERTIAAKKEKRKTQKMRKKMKRFESLETPAKKDRTNPNPDIVKATKKEQKMLVHQRLLKAQGSAPKVCIDLGFVTGMDNKDLIRLACQLRRLYGSNRHSLTPLHLCFVNFSKSGEFYQTCLVKNDGFLSYVVEMHEESPESLFDLEKIIYLSPDSEDVLKNLEQDCVYIIGGIVDANVKKGLTLGYAKEHGIRTMRLPIPEYLDKVSTNPGSSVLTVNQVFDILLKFYETNDWIQALNRNVPMRKGYGITNSNSTELDSMGVIQNVEVLKTDIKSLKNNQM